MILSDGSHVWLNAGSSLTYPVVFINKNRQVELKGEGYFEIAKDPVRKFVVNANGMKTEVLGTHFNVNAYNNEPRVRVTLVEGSVQVSNNGRMAVTIRPGQQASGQTDGQGQISVKAADVEKEIAWKYGLFNLEGATLKEAMRQLERWYDIEVIYESGTKDIELTGKMTRGVTLNGLMLVLKELGVNYRMEGRKLFILP
jgi:ferric-dicitrate binding protein FerR (iron transport regulator)